MFLYPQLPSGTNENQNSEGYGSGVVVKSSFALSMSVSEARVEDSTTKEHVVAAPKPLERKHMVEMRVLSSATRMIEFSIPPPKFRRNVLMAEATVYHRFSRQARLLGRRCTLHGDSNVCFLIRCLPEEFEEYKRPQSERQISYTESVSLILKLPKIRTTSSMSSFSLSTKKRL